VILGCECDSLLVKIQKEASLVFVNDEGEKVRELLKPTKFNYWLL
jgi:hypothetical protein